jgi:hypothetical protein
MSRSLLALAALALASTTASLAAQVTALPGTGCSLPATTVVLGTPHVGQTIVITNPFATACLLQVGIVIGGVPDSVPFPNCVGTMCTLGVTPISFAVGLVTASLVVNIPNDPSLVGFCFDAQSGCVSSCINVDRAVRICVQ